MVWQVVQFLANGDSVDDIWANTLLRQVVSALQTESSQGKPWIVEPRRIRITLSVAT